MKKSFEETAGDRRPHQCVVLIEELHFLIQYSRSLPKSSEIFIGPKNKNTSNRSCRNPENFTSVEAELLQAEFCSLEGRLNFFPLNLIIYFSKEFMQMQVAEEVSSQTPKRSYSRIGFEVNEL